MVTVWRWVFFVFQNKPAIWWRKKRREAWLLIQTLKFKRRKGNTRHFPEKTKSTSVEFVGRFSGNVRISCSTRWYTRERSHTYVMSAANHLTKDRFLTGTRLHTLERNRGYVMSAVYHLTEYGILKYTSEHTQERSLTGVRCVRKLSVREQTSWITNGHTPERSLTVAACARKPSVENPALWIINGHTPERSLTVAACARKPSVKKPALWNINGHTPERNPTSAISVKRHLFNDPIFYVIIGPTLEIWTADQCDTCKKIWGLKSSTVFHAKHKLSCISTGNQVHLCFCVRSPLLCSLLVRHQVTSGLSVLELLVNILQLMQHLCVPSLSSTCTVMVGLCLSCLDLLVWQFLECYLLLQAILVVILTYLHYCCAEIAGFYASLSIDGPTLTSRRAWPSPLITFNVGSGHYVMVSNGSHFVLPTSSIHKMTRLGVKMVWTMTYAHRPHWTKWKKSITVTKFRALFDNRPFAQLLPGLETGHPVTVGQSLAYDFSVSEKQKAVFLVSVSDCSVCDSCAGDWPTVTGCPVSNPGNMFLNCANGLLGLGCVGRGQWFRLTPWIGDRQFEPVYSGDFSRRGYQLPETCLLSFLQTNKRVIIADMGKTKNYTSIDLFGISGFLSKPHFLWHLD